MTRAPRLHDRHGQAHAHAAVEAVAGAAGGELERVRVKPVPAAGDAGIELGYGEARRNVVTRGVDLNGLVGKPFRVGELRCVGVEPCDPCRHLERLTKPGVLRGLVGRGGLRADVVRGGEIAVGDSVEAI